MRRGCFRPSAGNRCGGRAPSCRSLAKSTAVALGKRGMRLFDPQGTSRSRGSLSRQARECHDDGVNQDRHEERLRSAVDAIVPADGFPSASQAGCLRFWNAMLAGERPEWWRRVGAVLDLLDVAAGGSFFPELDQEQQHDVLERLAADPNYVWFASMTNYAFYAEPTAWSMLGWGPDPEGGWPRVEVPPLDRTPVIRRDQLLPRYDAIVIGSGAGGGVAACSLTENGRSVLLVERGDYPDRAFLAQDHLRNARTDIGLDHRTLVSSAENPRVLQLDDHSVLLPASDPRWGSNAYTLGGGTRIYGAQAWRLVPEDFRMASTYGVPDGSALADWPISYDDLEPFYSQAEWEIGACGSTVGDSRLARSSRPFPMPPVHRFHLPDRGQERLSQHHAGARGSDWPPACPAGHSFGTDRHRPRRPCHRRCITW